MSNNPIKSYLFLLTLYTVLFITINFDFYKARNETPIEEIAIDLLNDPNSDVKSLILKQELEVYLARNNNVFTKYLNSSKFTVLESEDDTTRPVQVSRLNVHNFNENGDSGGSVGSADNISLIGTTSNATTKGLMTASSGECHPIPQKKMKQVSLDDCSVPWASVHHGGRLGNNICEYSALWLLRHIYGIRVRIADTMSSRLYDVFENLSIPIRDKSCDRGPVKYLSYKDFYRQLHSTVQNTMKDAMPPSVLRYSTYIWDHPCPSDLMMMHRDQLKKELVYHPPIIDAANRQKERALRNLSSKLLSNNHTIITVHVRRNDRIRIYRKYYNISTYLSESYYYRAFDYFRKRLAHPVFLVMSDDPAWSKTYLSAKDVIFAGSGDKKHPESDLALISLGDHHITSHGTFGFLGALLGHGTIVYPANFHNVTTKLENHYECLHPDYNVIGIPAD